MSDPLEVITRLEELERAATKAEWISDSVCYQGDFHILSNGFVIAEARYMGGTMQARCNSEFIPAIRNAAPALLKALRCLLAEREQLKVYVACNEGESAEYGKLISTSKATDAALKELSEVKL